MHGLGCKLSESTRVLGTKRSKRFSRYFLVGLSEFLSAVSECAVLLKLTFTRFFEELTFLSFEIVVRDVKQLALKIKRNVLKTSLSN